MLDIFLLTLFIVSAKKISRRLRKEVGIAVLYREEGVGHHKAIDKYLARESLSILSPCEPRKTHDESRKYKKAKNTQVYGRGGEWRGGGRGGGAVSNTLLVTKFFWPLVHDRHITLCRERACFACVGLLHRGDR